MSVEAPALAPSEIAYDQRLARTPEPAAVVIFGASGDLTTRKLMPAIEQLALKRLLPGGFSVVGVARTEMDDDDFREAMRKAVAEDSDDGEGRGKPSLPMEVGERGQQLP